MTHSLLPWTLEVPTLAEAHGAHLKSADGTVIAYFCDYRDADLVLANMPNPCDRERWTVKELLEKVNELEEDNKAVLIENDQLHEQVAEFEKSEKGS